jgi:acetyl-CoA decarbonylase/synthase complex subunit gamma
MTFSTVSSDIKSANLNCYLLVADTEGAAVGISVLLKKINGKSIAKLIEESGVKEKIHHRFLIIPGLLAPIKEEIAATTEMEVLVGPLESTKIPLFMRTEWADKLV